MVQVPDGSERLYTRLHAGSGGRDLLRKSPRDWLCLTRRLEGRKTTESVSTLPAVFGPFIRTRGSVAKGNTQGLCGELGA